jgi:hypothetical protein
MGTTRDNHSATCGSALRNWPYILQRKCQTGVWSPTQKQGAKSRLLDFAPGGLGRIVVHICPRKRHQS